MNKLSQSSITNLKPVHTVLQQCVMFALQYIDVGVTCGRRAKAEQQELYASGKSQVEFPDSKHNLEVPEAVDLVIYEPQLNYLTSPLGCYHGSEYFYMQYARLDTLMQLRAAQLGWRLRWGGKWSRPHDLLDNTLIDVFHWELWEEI